MRFLYFILLAVTTFILSCTGDTGLKRSDFTPVSDIDPKVYFESSDNIKADPSNQLLSFFRDKKIKDMADSLKPRPFALSDIGQIENRSFEQEWTSVEKIFKSDWDTQEETAIVNLSAAVKTRLVFNNPDLKVVEMAIAAGGTLPMHAQPTPSVYHILGGSGEVVSGDSMSVVGLGMSVMFDSYMPKRVKVTSEAPMKILWFSWAPEGDKSYLESGYYLTGCNPHIQAMDALLPNDFSFWEADESGPVDKVIESDVDDIDLTTYPEIENAKNYYPKTTKYKAESSIEWVDVVNLDPKSFFFANDLKKLGSVMDIMAAIATIKSVFRAKRPVEGYDLNYSYLAWGPLSKYITHSHAICEFYYILDGDVEYIINDVEYHGVPGNFYFHPPYYNHEMRGLSKDVSFLSISGTWVPFGRRELFDKPFIWLEDITQQNVAFPNDFDFHKFKMKQGLKYGKLSNS